MGNLEAEKIKNIAFHALQEVQTDEITISGSMNVAGGGFSHVDAKLVKFENSEDTVIDDAILPHAHIDKVVYSAPVLNMSIFDMARIKDLILDFDAIKRIESGRPENSNDKGTFDLYNRMKKEAKKRSQEAIEKLIKFETKLEERGFLYQDELEEKANLKYEANIPLAKPSDIGGIKCVTFAGEKSAEDLLQIPGFAILQNELGIISTEQQPGDDGAI